MRQTICVARSCPSSDSSSSLLSLESSYQCTRAYGVIDHVASASPQFLVTNRHVPRHVGDSDQFLCLWGQLAQWSKLFTPPPVTLLVYYSENEEYYLDITCPECLRHSYSSPCFCPCSLNQITCHRASRGVTLTQPSRRSQAK